MAKHSFSGSRDSSDDQRNRAPGIRSNLTFLLLFGLLLVGYVFKSQNNPPRERGTTNDVSQDAIESSKPPLPDHSGVDDDQPSSSPVTKAPTNERTAPVVKSPDLAPEAPSKKATDIRDITLRDQNGRVIYRGDVDLAPTLKRIEDGQRLSFPNDGSVFQNREGRLPKKSSGYYQEWVHPTPKQSGPGPQRIVTGKEGEIFYTHDHYRTFRRIQ